MHLNEADAKLLVKFHLKDFNLQSSLVVKATEASSEAVFHIFFENVLDLGYYALLFGVAWVSF